MLFTKDFGFYERNPWYYAPYGSTVSYGHKERCAIVGIHILYGISTRLWWKFLLCFDRSKISDMAARSYTEGFTDGEEYGIKREKDRVFRESMLAEMKAKL